ncbi:MAG TPA: AsnC family protein [Lacisediminihabitans sp.]|uniref:AsnC family protein n=1 Tax=Lacisediminihabitans sp. TaxID=2787631 RepID=UPI002ED98AFF
MKTTLTKTADAAHPLNALHAVSELRTELDRYEATLVRRARNLGMGWQMIATDRSHRERLKEP